ncbi:MAG: chemotaxis protein CheB [Planctomycetaceae bacterium]|nr:chemotaxis protein CheB [Planctomycetaceae bacterium]
MSIRAVVIGTSAGAVDALLRILPKLPESFVPPVIVVVHLPADRRSVMVELFEARCRIAVREVEDKEPLVPGTIYFAPPDYHVLVEADGRLSLSSEEPVHYSRPSIDVLFESAADVFCPSLVGVVLTGANMDGATGLRMIQRGGGAVVVQRPDSAYASTMPQAALDACPGALSLTLDQIADYLCELTMVR